MRNRVDHKLSWPGNKGASDPCTSAEQSQFLQARCSQSGQTETVLKSRGGGGGGGGLEVTGGYLFVGAPMAF